MCPFGHRGFSSFHAIFLSKFHAVDFTTAASFWPSRVRAPLKTPRHHWSGEYIYIYISHVLMAKICSNPSKIPLKWVLSMYNIMMMMIMMRMMRMMIIYIYIYEPFDESHLVDRLFTPTCRMSWDFQHGLVDQLLATCWSPSTQRKLVSSLPTELMLAAMKFIHSTRWWFGTCGLWLSIQLGISSSQLTLTPSFFRGVGLNHQPDN